jgi:hypothetical protein
VPSVAWYSAGGVAGGSSSWDHCGHVGSASSPWGLGKLSGTWGMCRTAAVSLISDNYIIYGMCIFPQLSWTSPRVLGMALLREKPSV